MHQAHDPTVATNLGLVIEEFKPGLVRVVIGILGCLMLISGGVALCNFCVAEILARNVQLPLFAAKGISWSLAGVVFLLTMLPIIGAYFIVIYVQTLMKTSVELCSGGFRYHCLSVCDEVAWEHIEFIEEIIIRESPPILHWPACLFLPPYTSISYVVHTYEKSYDFDADSVRAIRAFGQRLRNIAEANGITWRTLEDRKWF